VRTPSCRQLRIERLPAPDPVASPLLPPLRNTAMRRVILQHWQLTTAQLMAGGGGGAGRVGRPIAARWQGNTLYGSLELVQQALQEGRGDVVLGWREF
jgi:hypothetical protein